MSKLNEKADIIEQLLGHLIKETRRVENPPSEYAMYIDPVISDTWLLVVYFPTIEKLRKALKSGLCYNMHTFLKQLLDVQQPLKEQSFHIIFDHGLRPQSEKEAVSYFGKKYHELDKLSESEAKSTSTCAHCGHPMDDHQMLGIPNKESGQMEEGWIICPDELCTCFHTWSVKMDVLGNSATD